MLSSRHLPPEAATRHPKRCHLPILDTPYSILAHSPLHLCTVSCPPALRPSGPRVLELCPQPTIRFSHAAPLSAVSSPCQRVTLSTCQLVIRSGQLSLWASRPLACLAASLAHMSPCQLAPSRLRRAHLCTRPRRICTFARSLVLRPSGPHILAHASLVHVSTCQPPS
jgi:hypothetical protein